MTDAFLNHIRATLDEIDAAGLTKRERLLTGPQGGRIHVASPQGAREAVNLCANNYLGPRRSPGRHRGGAPRHGPIRLRHGFGALHLRRADAAS